MRCLVVGPGGMSWAAAVSSGRARAMSATSSLDTSVIASFLGVELQRSSGECPNQLILRGCFSGAELVSRVPYLAALLDCGAPFSASQRFCSMCEFLPLWIR